MDNIIINRLASLANDLGGQLVLVDDDKFKKCKYINTFSIAPFVGYNLAVDYCNKIVYYEKNSNWGHIIHEMAHVFASNLPPDQSDEITFIGWEFATAKYINAPIDMWYEQLSDYLTDSDVTFSSLSEEEKANFLADRMSFCMKENMIQDNGKPLSIRN